MHLTLAVLRLVYTSHSHPLGALTWWLSWIIIVGACYGAIRLIFDVIRLFQRIEKIPGKGEPPPP